MKKAILNLALVVVALLGMNFSAMAQNTTGKAVPADGPKIKVDKEVHDFGTLEQGGDATCTFTVTNVGNQPLIISTCKGSCGCTVPTCPKEPIAPGASATISVKYDSKRVGPINKSVTITSNAVNQPREMVRIKGTIKAKPTGSAPVNTGTPTNH